MQNEKLKYDTENLRFVSSGTKIWNQFFMFILIGLLPIFFPQFVQIKYRTILLINIGVALATSYIFEIWKYYLEKHKKNTNLVVNLQLVTSVVLLTEFLHFFGRINGPFFVLYLLTVMESFLNINIRFSNVITWTMILATFLEFIWLVWTREIIAGFYPILELFFRLVSLVFIRSYGIVLAKKIVSEQNGRKRVEETAERLENVTKELQQANAKLKELSLLKDEFVSIASHELRTPMTTIKSYLWLVLNKAKNLDEKAKRDLQIAYESTERTIILVKDMLTVSRIEGNRLDITFSAFDLKELASQVVNELKIKAGERNIKLTIRPFSEDLVINGDRDKIGEVFQNIIGNALKFTPERGNVEVYFQKKNRMVEVSISDDGPGISKKDISKLFQKFSRLGNSLSKMAETPGTGLGLYIAKQIVGLHKGKIWVESIVGKGSTFIFSLPLGERTYVGRK